MSASPPVNRMATAILSAALLLASCGTSTGTAVRADTGDSFSGIKFQTPTAVTFSQGDYGSVMIDGLNSSNSAAHLRVTLIHDKSPIQVFDSDAESALVGPIAWMSGTTLFIAASACPNWSREAAMENSDGSDLDKICGTSRQELLSLKLDTGKWTTIATSLDEQKFPLYASFGDAPYALMGTSLSSRLNLDGTIETLNTAKLPKNSSFTPCVTNGGAIALAHALSPDRAPLGLFTLVDGNWEPAPISDDSILSLATIGCTADGLFLTGSVKDGEGARFGVLSTTRDGKPIFSNLAAPEVGKARTVTTDSVGHAIASDGANPTGPSLLLTGSTWIPLRSSVPEGARQVIVIGSQVNWIDNNYASAGAVRGES